MEIKDKIKVVGYCVVLIMLIASCSENTPFPDKEKNEFYIVTHYDNGNIKDSIGYKNGKREGKSIYFSENGVLLRVNNYVNDKVVGCNVLYHENGRVKSIFWRDSFDGTYYVEKFDEGGKKIDTEGYVISPSIGTENIDSIFIGDSRSFKVYYAEPESNTIKVIMKRVNGEVLKQVERTNEYFKFIDSFDKEGKVEYMAIGELFDSNSKLVRRDTMVCSAMVMLQKK